MPRGLIQVARALVSFVVVVAVVGVCRPLPVQACSCAGKLTATPADGAADVPLDVSPVVIGMFNAESVRWESLAGEAVPFDLRHTSDSPQYCTGATAELVPRAVLAPNTTYVVRAARPRTGVQQSGDQEFRFSTGDARTIDSVPAPPPLSITLVRGNLYRSSCTSDVHGCLSVGDVETEVSVLDAQDQRLGWFITRGASPFERVHPNVACVEARTRDAAGRRSAPIRRCGAELGLRDSRPSDYKSMQQLNCEAGQIVDNPANMQTLPDAGAGEHVADASPDASFQASLPDADDEADGCSALGGKPGSWTSGLLVALALLLSRRTRRRR